MQVRLCVPQLPHLENVDDDDDIIMLTSLGVRTQ